MNKYYIPTLLIILLSANVCLANEFPLWEMTGDQRTWKAENVPKGDQGYLIEFILPEEKIETWSELVSQQYFKTEVKKIEMLVKNILKELSQNCPTFNNEFITKGNKKIIYKWSHNGCGDYPPTHEISRVELTDGGIMILRYSIYPEKADISHFIEWEKVITEARIKYDKRIKKK